MDKLHYTSTGQKGIPLIFLHGFLEDSRMWERYVNHFSNDRKILCIDLPGHGKSIAREEVYTMEKMADLLYETLNSLSIKSGIFIGHSMGGYVALAFAEKFPKMIKALVLINSTCLPDTEEKKEQRLNTIENILNDKKSFIRLSIPKLFYDIKANKKEINLLRDWAFDTSTSGMIAALKGMRLRPDRTHVLVSRKVYTLLIIGIYDQAINTKELYEKLHGVSSIQIQKLETGHMSVLEKPKLCLDLISNFTQKIC